MSSAKRMLLISMFSMVITLLFTSMAFAYDFTENPQNSDSSKSDIITSLKCCSHKIISDKPYYLKDADTDTWYDKVKGKVLIEWNSKIPGYSLLKAELQVSDSLNYQFELVSAENSSDDSIIGTFNIKRNGKLVAANIYGQLYGLNAKEGDYFKFYSDDFNWHFSAYVTCRIDK